MMKKILIIAVLACLAASQAVVQCPKDNREVMCLFIDEPVCAIKYHQGKQVKSTYSNHCIACYFGKSEFTVEGRCEEFPSDAEFCSPQESQNQACPRNYDPHCGWFNQDIKCVAYPCAVDGGNRCDACSQENVLYTTKDVCPKP